MYTVHKQCHYSHPPLRLLFHQRRNRSCKWSGKSAYDLVKIKTRSCKQSHKSNRIGVRRIRTFPFLPTLLMTPSLMFRLKSSESQIVGVRSRRGRINQSQCTFPHFVIGLVLPLLLPTPTIWFSLDHKRNVSDGVLSRIRMLFSLDLYSMPLIMTPTSTLSLVKTSL